MQIGKKMSKLRGGHSPEWVAKAISCHGGSIRRYETGEQKPRYDRALKLAVLFGVDTHWLLDDQQDWPPPETVADKTAELVSQALAGAGLAGELTDDERQLLSRWRHLNDRQQGRVLGMVEGLGEAAADSAEEIPPHERMVLDKVRDLVGRELDKRDRADSAKQRRGAG